MPVALFGRLVAIGLVAGVFSSLFGVGGGLVIVPLLLLFAAFPPHQATATSFGAIAITALAGAAAYALRHDIRYAYAALVGSAGNGRRAERGHPATALLGAIADDCVLGPARRASGSG